MLVAMLPQQMQQPPDTETTTVMSGLLQLPNLSPLSGVRSLRSTPAIENITSQLQSRGYDAAFSGGTLRLSASPVRSPTTNSCGQDYNALVSLLSTPTEARRPRTAPTTFLSMKPIHRSKEFSSMRAVDDSRLPDNQTVDDLQIIRQQRENQGALSVQGAYSPQQAVAPGLAPALGRHPPKPPVLDSRYFAAARPPTSPAASPQHAPGSVWPPVEASGPCEQRPAACLATLPGLLTSPGACQALGHRPGTAMSCTLASATEQLDAQVSAMEAEQERQGPRSLPWSSRPGTAASPSNTSPNSRPKQVHPMSRWRPTRAHALLVFHAVDGDKNGKITQAEFEDAAISIGFNDKQAANTFRKLDGLKRGYLEYTDWGCKDMMAVVEAFTTMYMHRHMGLPDITAPVESVKRYFHQQKLREVKSLPAAINMARVNAVARGTSNGSGGSPIYEAFRFIDIDGSGDLSKGELRDGFFAMGVNLADQVAEQIMEVFDSDGNGTVNYYEFVKVMFPKQGKGMG